MMTATEPPTATPPPELDPCALVSPKALAVLVPALVAVMVTGPAASSAVALLAIAAIVFSWSTVAATTASSAVPPAAPPEASLSVLMPEVADTVTAPAPVKLPVPIEAWLVCSRPFSATVAPTPSLLPVMPAPAGEAITVDVPSLSASMETGPPLNLTVAALSTSAVLLVLTASMARAPATPIPAPPAPASAVAEKTFV